MRYEILGGKLYIDSSSHRTTFFHYMHSMASFVICCKISCRKNCSIQLLFFHLHSSCGTLDSSLPACQQDDVSVVLQPGSTIDGNEYL